MYEPYLIRCELAFRDRQGRAEENPPLLMQMNVSTDKEDSKGIVRIASGARPPMRDVQHENEVGHEKEFEQCLPEDV
jgi:hypothetical protein